MTIFEQFHALPQHPAFCEANKLKKLKLTCPFKPHRDDIRLKAAQQKVADKKWPHPIIIYPYEFPPGTSFNVQGHRCSYGICDLFAASDKNGKSLFLVEVVEQHYGRDASYTPQRHIAWFDLGCRKTDAYGGVGYSCTVVKDITLKQLIKNKLDLNEITKTTMEPQQPSFFARVNCFKGENNDRQHTNTIISKV